MTTHGTADEDALVREILADPSDAVARSVYADWLEDNGRPHHAELARFPTERDDERIDTDEYWEKARAAAPKPGIRIIHRSGFAAAQVSGRDLTSKPFLAGGPAWLHAHHITWLEVDNVGDWPKAVTALAAAGTRGLRLIGRLDRPSGLEALAGLQALWLPAGVASQGWLEELSGCAALGSLVRLVLPQNYDLKPAAMQKMAHGPLASLRNLDLSGTGMRDEAAAILIDSPLAESLVSLSLAGCWLTVKTMNALAASTRLRNLRCLDLRGHYLNAAGIAALLLWPHLRRLGRLHVLGKSRYHSIADESLASLRAVLGDRLIAEEGR